VVTRNSKSCDIGDKKQVDSLITTPIACAQAIETSGVVGFFSVFNYTLVVHVQKEKIYMSLN
jgi:hypothetical protein